MTCTVSVLKAELAGHLDISIGITGALIAEAVAGEPEPQRDAVIAHTVRILDELLTRSRGGDCPEPG